MPSNKQAVAKLNSAPLFTWETRVNNSCFIIAFSFLVIDARPFPGHRPREEAIRFRARAPDVAVEALPRPLRKRRCTARKASRRMAGDVQGERGPAAVRRVPSGSARLGELTFSSSKNTINHTTIDLFFLNLLISRPTRIFTPCRERPS